MANISDVRICTGGPQRKVRSCPRGRPDPRREADEIMDGLEEARAALGEAEDEDED